MHLTFGDNLFSSNLDRSTTVLLGNAFVEKAYEIVENHFMYKILSGIQINMYSIMFNYLHILPKCLANLSWTFLCNHKLV